MNRIRLEGEKPARQHPDGQRAAEPGKRRAGRVSQTQRRGAGDGKYAQVGDIVRGGRAQAHGLRVQPPVAGPADSRKRSTARTWWIAARAARPRRLRRRHWPCSTVISAARSRATSAERVAKEAGDDPVRQIAQAYRIALVRSPTPTQQTLALDFLQKQMRLHLQDGQANKPAQTRPVADTPNQTPAPDVKALKAAQQTALADLCHVLLNTNEFIYLD